MNNNTTTKPSLPIKIKRARDFYLYDTQGNRFVDCSVCDTNALLGHKPNNINKRLKQALDHGLWGIDNGRETLRAITHLNAYIQGWSVSHIISASNVDALRHHHVFSQNNIRTIHELFFEDDGLRKDTNDTPNEKPDNKPNDACIWRAFSHIKRESLHTLNATYLFTPLPLPWKTPLFAVYMKKQISEVYIEISEVLLAGLNYIIPYLIEKGTTQRPLYNIAKNRKDIFIIDKDIATHNHRFQSHTLSLPPAWTRRNIYHLLPAYTPADYNKVRNIFFEQGFFFPPITSDASANTSVPRIIVLPPYMTKHEIDKWVNACETI